MPNPVGIDLGTTNSVVCVRRRGRLETIPIEGRPTLPSAISVKPDGVVLVGKAAKARAMLQPSQSVTSAKRCLGDGETEWAIGGKVYTPIDVSALILKRLKDAAEVYLGEPVREAVITVPAYFTSNQKRETKIAGEQAGLAVLQLLPEPTAAAIAYGLDKGKDQTLMVYDLGGGTFDVSVLKVKGNRFDVVAVDGDFRLGGDDFDAILVEHLLDRLQRQVKTDLGVIRSLLRGGKEMGSPPDMLLARQRLKEAAERAKIELSESDAAQVTIPDILGTSLDAEIKLSEYNRLISPLVDRTLTKMRDVLKAAKCGSADIDRVILVGGSTRNRLVRERVANAVKEPWVSDRVDEVVAQGAAIVASHLSAPDVDMTPEEVSTPIEIQNVTPFSLGVCAKAAKGQMQYINSIILQKNSPVPSMQARQYELQTGPNRDNELDVFMLQGEDHDPAQCLAVGKYIFSDVRHSPGGVTPVSIEYGYDRSGIITAKAWETQTRRSLPLRVQPLPEDLSWLHELQQRGRFDPSSLQLVVSQPGYDDVAALLRSLHLPFQEYVRGQPLSCDILFLNCLASDYPEVTQLSQYVADGGCLYASCCVAGHLGETFSEAIQFHPSGCRSEKIRADVVDPELAAVLGKHLSIEYDSAACYTITRLGVGGQVLLRESKTQEEVMVMAPYGKGYIFYTCFHHHKNISQPEKQLLQLLVMKQISAVSGIPIEAISQTVRHH